MVNIIIHRIVNNIFQSKTDVIVYVPDFDTVKVVETNPENFGRKKEKEGNEFVPMPSLQVLATSVEESD